MWFLLEYHRESGALKITEFDNSSDAMRARVTLEREVPRGVEVVVLVGKSLETLRRTHARYFKSATEILRETADSLRTVKA